MAVPFLCVLRNKADASSCSFLGQNSFQHRFLSNAWVRRDCESFYKLSFAFQSLLNQHHSKPTGCHASQSCRWQICHVMSDLSEGWKGRDPPSHSCCTGEACALIWKRRFLHALWLLSVKASHFCTQGSNHFFTLKAPEKLDKVISGRPGLFSIAFILPKSSFFWYSSMTMCKLRVD